MVRTVVESIVRAFFEGDTLTFLCKVYPKNLGTRTDGLVGQHEFVVMQHRLAGEIAKVRQYIEIAA